MTEPQKPREPKIGEYVRGRGKLVEIRDVTPPPPPKQFAWIFEETTARIDGRVAGKVLKTFCEIRDAGEEGSCVNLAIEEAKKLAREYPGVTIVVVKVKQLAQMRPEWGECPQDRQFVDLRYTSTPYFELPEPVEEVVYEIQC